MPQLAPFRLIWGTYQISVARGLRSTSGTPTVLALSPPGPEYHPVEPPHVAKIGPPSSPPCLFPRDGQGVWLPKLACPDRCDAWILKTPRTSSQTQAASGMMKKWARSACRTFNLAGVK
ncbi:hypothetical protein NDU88_007357 [Pleurodeles waltl]|uniref:Uncharacterized protein n=1 Tax=Pleurodeles waltl TaxID=8319 RepID=A0AAV7UQ86_PLEWA|nr:hypothetical protein NDU88_007357 [Pleurodeles waltl]